MTLRWDEGDAVAFVSTEDGARWDVRELPARRGRDACLIFDCRDVTHVVRSYPADWRALTAEGLTALLGMGR